ncbi:MAG: M20/M25/M40 family metallo-hydrolase [Steroidobacteraceae bacterium]
MKKITAALACATLPTLLCAAGAFAKDTTPEEVRRQAREIFQKVIEENGYFFGRGTLDNKQGVTTLTTTFLRLKREGFVPTRDLIIVFSGDEETGMLTTTDLATKQRALTDAEYALNSDDGGGQLDESTGKPQYLSFVGAEKISATYELTVHNPGGHSSAPRADNAINELADAVKALQAYRFPVKYNDWTLGNFKATGPVTAGPLGEAMQRFAANPEDEAAAAAIAAVPTEIGKTRTTCVATMLRGGHASNALPQTATATVSCRIFPGTSVDEVKAKLQELVGSKVEVRAMGNTPPADASPLRRDVLAAVDEGGARALSRTSGRTGHGAVGDRRRDLSWRRHSDVRRFRLAHQSQRRLQSRPQRTLAGRIVLRRTDALVRAAEGACRQALGQLPMGRSALALVSRFAGTCPSAMALPRYRKSVESTS